MRLLLQQRPQGHEAPRFVQLMLQPDLFGGWELLRETGQIGGRSTVRREVFLDQATALAARLSTVLGMAPAEDGDRLEALLQRLGLPTRIPADLASAALIARMRLDKKADAHGLRFVLWDGAGSARVVAGVDEETVGTVLDAGAG